MKDRLNRRISGIGKRILSMILIAIMVISFFVNANDANVTNAASTATPSYMVKLEGDGSNWGWLYQNLSGLDSNKTYIFSCDYYATASGGCTLAAWQRAGEYNKYMSGMKTGMQGRIELSCQPNENGGLSVRFDIGPNSLSYAWNVSLKAAGSDEELLKNANFEQGNGSLSGWINDNTNSSVIPYDSSLVQTESDNKDYMAKVEGNGTDWGWLYQRLSGLDASKTYIFSCEYYATLSGGATMAAWWKDTEMNKYTAGMKAGQKGKIELRCQPNSTGNLNVRFDIGPKSLCYVWNVSLKAEGSNTELLTNADFRMGKGSLNGWESSDNNSTVVLYDSSIFGSENESDDRNYMVKLTGDGKKSEWMYQRLTGLDPNKTYIFTSEYYADYGGSATMVAWHNDKESNIYSVGMTGGQKGKLELRCKPDSAGKLNVRFDIGPKTLCYIWNVSLKAEGSNTELLQNADFRIGKGSLQGWGYGANYSKVLVYDSSLFKTELESDNRKYMAKIVGDGKNFEWIYQRISGLNPNKTYIFSCEYYADYGGAATLAAWHNDKESALYTAGMSGGKQGKIELKCKPNSKGNLNVRFDVGPNAKCYVWNVSLKAQGSNKELLQNADFRLGKGSFNGWNNGTANSKVLVYDSSLFKTELESDNRQYMAKLVGDGKGFEWMYQRLSGLDPKKTYVFTCEYYADYGGAATMAAWHNDKESGLYSVGMSGGKQGKLELECKPNSKGNLNVRFDIGPNAKCYVWNVSLKAKGSNKELLQNADFRLGKGSFHGWSIGGDKSVVLVYDSSLLKSELEKDNRDYMVKIQGNGKDYGWLYQRLSGLDPDKTYIFSFEYCTTETGITAAAWWNDNDSLLFSTGAKRYKYGKKKLECKASDKGTMSVRFDISPDDLAYVWNISLKEKGSKVELLENADFRLGKGSFVGWNNSDSNSVVLPYDSALINSLIAEYRSLTDYEDPNVAFRFEDADMNKQLDIETFGEAGVGNHEESAEQNTDDNSKDKGILDALGQIFKGTDTDTETQTRRLSTVSWVGIAVILASDIGIGGYCLVGYLKRKGVIKQKAKGNK